MSFVPRISAWPKCSVKLPCGPQCAAARLPPLKTSRAVTPTESGKNYERSGNPTTVRRTPHSKLELRADRRRIEGQQIDAYQLESKVPFHHPEPARHPTRG